MLFYRETVSIPLQNPKCLPTHSLFRLIGKAASRGLDRCRCSNDWTPRASPVPCAGYNVDCSVGEAGARSVVGGVVVFTKGLPDVGGNRAVATSAGASVAFSVMWPKLFTWP